MRDSGMDRSNQMEVIATPKRGFTLPLGEEQISGNENDRGYIHIQADRSFWTKIDMKDQNNAYKQLL